MEILDFYDYACSPLPPKNANLSGWPQALSCSTDCFSIQLDICHETQFEVYGEEAQEFQYFNSKFLFTCKELLSDHGPIILKGNIFSYDFVPEEIIEEATPEIINICREMFESDEVIQSRKHQAEGHPHRPVILPVRIQIHHLIILSLNVESMQEFRTVPASEEAIESLKKVDFSHEGSEDENERCCTICLDELIHEGLEMPCSHAYHQDCIIQWLKTSNMCPLCRYQLPR